MKKIIPMFIPHLGCPHQCVFCDQKNISGKAKAIQGKDIRQEVLLWRSYFTGNHDYELAFYGGSFTLLPKDILVEYLKVGKRCIEEGLISSMRCSTRPDGISDDILELCMYYELDTIELGVQSMRPHVLEKAKRGHTVEDVYRSVQKIKKLPIQLGLQQMLGLPGSTREDDIITTDCFISLSPDFVRIYPTVILEFTDLYDMYLQQQYRPLSLEEAIDLCGECYRKYQKSNISVIRMGLQATESLDQAEVLIGPYHPAFGQMVKSKVMVEDVVKGLTKVPKGKRYLLHVSKKDLPHVIGHKGHGRKVIEDFLQGKVKFCATEEIISPTIEVLDSQEVRHVFKNH